MDGRGDFLELLARDMSIDVLRRLDDPADLVRAASVSPSWRRFVVDNGFCKKLCMGMFPELRSCSHVKEHSISKGPAEVGSSHVMECDKAKTEHRVYARLASALKSSTKKKDCLLAAICASSTDNDPDESIENTLDSSDLVDRRPSYWSSKGASDPKVPETLTYRLCSKLCIVDEIKIQPFKAFFQFGHPIYSAKAVRFRMGFSGTSPDLLRNIDDEIAPGQRPDESDNYVWIYVSPEFPMVQENCLQTFKLPKPVLCIGGVLQIELLGRIQKQEMDGLFYICVCYVQVVGRPLPPTFDIEVPICGKSCMLKHFRDAEACPSSQSASGDEDSPMSRGGWLSFAARIRQSHLHIGARVWNRTRFLNALLGNPVVQGNESSDEDENDGVEVEINNPDFFPQ